MGNLRRPCRGGGARLPAGNGQAAASEPSNDVGGARGACRNAVWRGWGSLPYPAAGIANQQCIGAQEWGNAAAAPRRWLSASLPVPPPLAASGRDSCPFAAHRSRSLAPPCSLHFRLEEPTEPGAGIEVAVTASGAPARVGAATLSAGPQQQATLAQAQQDTQAELADQAQPAEAAEAQPQQTAAASQAAAAEPAEKVPPADPQPATEQQQEQQEAAQQEQAAGGQQATGQQEQKAQQEAPPAAEPQQQEQQPATVPQPAAQQPAAVPQPAAQLPPPPAKRGIDIYREFAANLSSCFASEWAGLDCLRQQQDWVRVCSVLGYRWCLASSLELSSGMEVLVLNRVSGRLGGSCLQHVAVGAVTCPAAGLAVLSSELRIMCFSSCLPRMPLLGAASPKPGAYAAYLSALQSQVSADARSGSGSLPACVPDASHRRCVFHRSPAADAGAGAVPLPSLWHHRLPEVRHHLPVPVSSLRHSGMAVGEALCSMCQ